jgi:hypothetical protein
LLIKDKKLQESLKRIDKTQEESKIDNEFFTQKVEFVDLEFSDGSEKRKQLCLMPSEGTIQSI